MDTLATQIGLNSRVLLNARFKVAGDESSVKNALMLLDGFFQRELQPVNGEPVQINVHPHNGIDIEDVKEDSHVHLHAHTHHRGLMSMASNVLAYMTGIGLPTLQF